MSETPIHIQNVSRSFGEAPVLSNLSISVKTGSIYGFLGRNGSGKTTLLRMLAGLIKPDAGTVRVLGTDPFTAGAKERQHLGYMSEKSPIAQFAKVRTILNLGRDLYPSWNGALADSLLSKYGISPGKRLTSLSQGNQRIVGFIMAIAPRPSVLLLDEPAANLDVVARRGILDDILELTRECGCTVLFSTHILSDVERVADEIGILADGRLRVSEPLDSLKESVRQVRFFGFRGSMPSADVPGSFRTTRSRGDLIVTMRVNSGDTPAALASRWACEHETRDMNLEDIFVELSSN
jgi:ABC-2 type transport system ATP-binding protein